MEKENVREIVVAGAVGSNIEHSLSNGNISAIESHILTIQALKEFKDEIGLDFVINARTCRYWLDTVGEEEKLHIAVELAHDVASFDFFERSCMATSSTLKQMSISQHCAADYATILIAG